VQRALRDGRPDEALRLLAEQERKYARGALHEERAASRVIALCAAGRVAEGRRARDRFLSSYPNSPAADRVRASCTP
jgi:outer membrane protein assembly factor BamD (BamD/ComL family)